MEIKTDINNEINTEIKNDNGDNENVKFIELFLMYD